MLVRCNTCHIRYDDMDHDSVCPHLYFRMHTIVGGKKPSSTLGDIARIMRPEVEMPIYEEFVVVTLDDLHAVQEHFAGRDTPGFARIASQEHVHTRGVLCTTPNVSGRLVETP